MSEIHVGIDLGTTNTVIASCKKPRINGYPQPIVREINRARNKSIRHGNSNWYRKAFALRFVF